MAIAGRVYKPFDAAFAQQCLAAARKAFAWLDKYPTVRFNNPQGVATGGYGDGNLADERLWAAAELYRTTGDEAYHGFFLENYAALRKSIQPAGPQGWGNVSTMGLWTYALGKGKNTEAVEAIRGDSIAAADAIVKRAAQNGYQITMTPRDYVWGSNGVVANCGLQLLVANVFKPNPAYLNTALDNLHYLLGRNTFSLSCVTQVGSNAFMNPHHRPSGADGIKEPWPGMLSGGSGRSGHAGEAQGRDATRNDVPGRAAGLSRQRDRHQLASPSGVPAGRGTAAGEVGTQATAPSEAVKESLHGESTTCGHVG